jgi:hypothetical protein
VVRHVEEDVRAEVLVAVRLTGVDRRNVDVDGDVRLLGSVGDLDDAVACALKRPRTLARPRWRTANSTAEWEASMAYVPGTGSSAPSTVRVRGAWAWVAVSVMVRS